MNQILYESWCNDGTIYVLIKAGETTTRYTYKVDAARIPGWKRRCIKAPWKVLNEIKKSSKSCWREKRT